MVATEWIDVARDIREMVAADYRDDPARFQHPDDCDRYAHERADGSQYVIYPRYARQLWVSDPEVRAFEDEARTLQSGDGLSIDEVVTTCVYLAIYTEIMRAFESLTRATNPVE